MTTALLFSSLNLVESGSVMVVIMVVAAMVAMVAVIPMPPIAPIVAAVRKNTPGGGKQYDGAN